MQSHLNDELIPLTNFCNSIKCNYQLNVSLKSFSYFKTGGTASIVLFPKSLNEILNVVDFLNKNSYPYKVVGETSNLLFLDDVNLKCLLVTTFYNSVLINSETNVIEAASGLSLPELARYALLNSIGGFEGFEGIPASIGGAVFMNAGAYGYEMKDILLGVDVLDHESKVRYIPVENLGLSNRSSIFRYSNNKLIILKAYFPANISNIEEIYDKMSIFHSKRHKYQEFLYPTLGSLFSGSVYRSLAKKSFIYKIFSSFYFLIFYKWKIFSREAPNNRRIFNFLTLKFFNLNFGIYSFSDKDMNTLVNRGQGTKLILEYIHELENLVGDDLKIENEIVFDQC